MIEDPQRFAQMFQNSALEQEQARRARMREIEALNADEFNPDAQARIEEMIRQESVVENLQNAMEHNPECKLSKSQLHIPVDNISRFPIILILHSIRSRTPPLHRRKGQRIQS